MKTAFETIRNT